MTDPKSQRWLRTRVPSKLGILIAVLVALLAGYEFYVFLASSSVLFLVFALLLFALSGVCVAGAMIKRRQEGAARNDRPTAG